MKFSKAGKNTYVTNEADGKLYIEARSSGISQLCFLLDGLPYVTFGKGKTPYITVEDAIKWHEKELTYEPNNDDRKKAIELLKNAIAVTNGE